VHSEISIDKAGRIVLPKAFRDQLQVRPGDTLDISLDGEQVTLRPRRATPPLQKERGVWVFRTGEPLTAAEVRETLDGIREHHDAGERR
jgi:AbrB family looped-hinge helix DNA binding protein